MTRCSSAPSWEGDRIDYALEACEAYPGRFGIMARVPQNKPAEGASLMREFAQNPHVAVVPEPVHRRRSASHGRPVHQVGLRRQRRGRALRHGQAGRELAAQAPAGRAGTNTPVEVLLDQWQPSAAVGPAPAAARVVAADEDVEAAARLLAAAQRPVLAVETAGCDPEGFAALVELAELLAIGVVEPQSAVCANFPRTHPLHQGGDLAALAADADLVVLVGCRAPWYPPSAKPGGATVLVIDETPHRPYMAYQVLTANRYVSGATAPTLRAIAARPREPGAGLDTAAIAARRRRLEEAHAVADAGRREAEERALASAACPVHPVAVTRTLRDLLDPGAVVVDETITHNRGVARHLMADAAGRYRYVQGGLGQGLGVALGAKLALGDRMAVLTVGDGAWLYNPCRPA